MADKQTQSDIDYLAITVAKSLADGNQLRFSNSKHFRFYSAEEMFNFRMMFF